MRAWRTLLIALAASLAAAPAVGANHLPIHAFYGHFVGIGVANSRDAEILNLKKRDLDVTIAKAGDGFSVAWVTIVRRGGLEQVDRKTAKMTFVPTASARVYKSTAHTYPISDLGYGWATLEDKTLTVYLLVVDPQSGTYQLHSYGRTLDGPDKMHLKFTRISQGRPKVIVEGDMARQK